MNNWISVKNELPKHESFVLVTTLGYIPRVASFHLDNDQYYFLSPDCMRIQFRGITHWMLLPNPPIRCKE